MTAIAAPPHQTREVFAYYQGETGSSDADQGTLLRFVEAGVMVPPHAPVPMGAVGEGCAQLLGPAWYPACGGPLCTAGPWGILGVGTADSNDKNQLHTVCWCSQPQQ